MLESIPMRDPVETYLENVLCWADLASADERSVRAELSEHLHQLQLTSPTNDPKEIHTMLNEQFGSEKKLGRAIAVAKGRIRTYFKKKRRVWPIQCATVIVLALAVRFAVAEPFYVAGEGVSPLIPKGARVLVYKWAGSFNPGDVVAYHHSDSEIRLGVIDHQTIENHWLVERTTAGKKETTELPIEKIVGRVILNTR
jgi:hypothetical protein